jgi:MerR family transcriptional regulator, redox-sensitive transcriptional activator SoxR
LFSDATLTIGQVAERAGLNVSAIRFYETKGLLPRAPRVAGQRRYSTEMVTRLGVIDVAKRAGFSLDEIRTLLTATDASEPAHAPLQELARRKLAEVDDLVARADAVRRWLTIATACGCATLDVCALFAEDEGLPAEGLQCVRMAPGSVSRDAE